MPQIGDFYEVPKSVFRIDMNIVTTGLGDLTAKQEINFDLYNSDYDQK